jgi:hypothetical protein
MIEGVIAMCMTKTRKQVAAIFVMLKMCLRNDSLVLEERVNHDIALSSGKSRG